MRAGVISGNVVVNVIEIDEALGPPAFDGVELHLDAGDSLVIGMMRQSDGSFALPPQPVETPASISRRQLRLWLLGVGLLGAVPEAIATIADADARAVAEIEWANADTIRRDNPLVMQLSAALGLSQEQVDLGFIAAAQY
jgi:hypothetical protein